MKIRKFIAEYWRRLKRNAVETVSYIRSIPDPQVQKDCSIPFFDLAENKPVIDTAPREFFHFAYLKSGKSIISSFEGADAVKKAEEEMNKLRREGEYGFYIEQEVFSRKIA